MGSHLKQARAGRPAGTFSSSEAFTRAEEFPLPQRMVKLAIGLVQVKFRPSPLPGIQ